MLSLLMAKRMSVIVLVLVLHITAPAQDQTLWLEQHELAKKRAAEQNKELLIYFTGSDWSPDCQTLDREILDQERFKTPAQHFFVLLKLDYPQTLAQTVEIKTQNSRLQTEFLNKHKLSGYPTIYLANAQGEPYARVGYRKEGPEAYFRHLVFLTRARPMVNPGTEWLESLADAQVKAGFWGRDLLLYFSGSDWCRWCKGLDERILSHEIFQQNIPLEFVLVKIDFPRQQEQTAWIIDQNQQLKYEYTEKHQLEGYPTLYLATADGQPYAKTVYSRTSAQIYVDRLMDLKAKHRERLRVRQQNDDPNIHRIRP